MIGIDNITIQYFINTNRFDWLCKNYFYAKIKGIKEYREESPFLFYLFAIPIHNPLASKKIEREEGLNNTPVIERKKREKKKTKFLVQSIRIFRN